MSSMASTNAYDCHHCGQRCGGRTEGGYGAITGADGAIHAACSPDDPTARPDCYRRVTEFGEAPGALRVVEPLPVSVEDIRV
ncbi:MAG TPA: hypothetical protein VHZ03_14255 [Trebonia sp.]|jgi:hypothetical protein|nr:hypothetical protein [Trebonia sp.]